ncbi:MAG: dihydrofolate reductase [Pediococcus parvulus]|jgi:dihydrofolate reductase
MLAFIWAESQNGVIGKQNKLPWRIPDDTQYFKKITTGHTVIMGRKTFESFGAKPLPHRLNVVLTRKTTLEETEELKVSHSITDLLKTYNSNDELVFVIGGKEIYQQLYPYVQMLYRTRIEQDFEGDTQMIPIDYSQWQLMQSIPGQGPQTMPIPHIFEIYKRIEPNGTNE